MPPCTDLIIRQKISLVVYGILDPNPIVAGKGIEKLEKEGITCRYLESSGVKRFYQSYAYWLNRKRPFVTAKVALSLDNKVAGCAGRPLSITGNECQNFTHQQRQQSDAILTTAKTIIADNPQLNIRLEQKIITKPVYILDNQLQLPLNSRVSQTTQSLTVFHSDEASAIKQKQLKELGVNCQAVAKSKLGLDLQEVLDFIGKEGRHDLWVEVGPYCFQSFLEQKLLQRAFLYIAPKILGPEATVGFTNSFDLLHDNDSVIVWSRKRDKMQ